MVGKLEENERVEISSFYNDRFENEGISIKSVGWKDRESQFLRFKMLFKDYDPTGKTILDVGCGFGDLVDYLDEITGGDFKYIGIDISSKLLEVAKEKHSRDNCEFIITDVFDLNLDEFEVDFAVESGMLSYRVEDNEKHAKAVMERMYAHAKEGVSLNFLTSYVDYTLDKNYHFSPEKVFGWAKGLSQSVVLRHDYPLWEFTIKMMKK